MYSSWIIPYLLFKKRGQTVWKMVPLAIAWGLWKERNKRIFESTPLASWHLVAWRSKFHWLIGVAIRGVYCFFGFGFTGNWHVQIHGCSPREIERVIPVPSMGSGYKLNIDGSSKWAARSSNVGDSNSAKFWPAWYDISASWFKKCHCSGARKSKSVVALKWD